MKGRAQLKIFEAMTREAWYSVHCTPVMVACVLKALSYSPIYPSTHPASLLLHVH